MLAKASLSEPQSASTETFRDPLFISRVIMTSLGVTAILTYVNVSPILIMAELGFDRGQYSYTMALTALVTCLDFPSQPRLLWMCLNKKNLMLTSQACFVITAILLLASIDGGLGHYVTLLGFAFVCVASRSVWCCDGKHWVGYSQRAGVASSILGVSQGVYFGRNISGWWVLSG